MIYWIPTRGFTAALSVFRGTPPTKPFKCKIWFRHSGALSRDRWTNPTGEEPSFSRLCFRLVSADIFKMPFGSVSQCDFFRSWLMSQSFMGKQKALLPIR